MDRRLTSSPAPARVAGVDIARGLALLSMYVAHVAPSGGPGGVLNLTEFATVALFSLLVGAGTTLAADRPRFVAGTLVRSAMLIVVGLLLAQAGAQVVIVLVHLGVLAVICAALVRLPSVALLAIGAATMLASPVVSAALEIWGTVWPYRVLTMTTWGCLGLVLARQLHRGKAFWWTILAAALAAVGALLLVKKTVWDFWPYDGSVPDTLTSGGLAVAAFALAIALPWPRWLAEPLRISGQMSLTLYSLHVLVLWWFAVARGNDDGWDTLFALWAGSWAFALLWHHLLPLVRGPLEAATSTLAHAVSPRAPESPHE